MLTIIVCILLIVLLVVILPIIIIVLVVAFLIVLVISLIVVVLPIVVIILIISIVLLSILVVLSVFVLSISLICCYTCHCNSCSSCCNCGCYCFSTFLAVLFLGFLFLFSVFRLVFAFDLGVNEFFLFLYQPAPVLAVFILGLVFSCDVALNSFESVRLPVRMLLDIWLVNLEATYVGSHNHYWNLSVRHGFLSGTCYVVLEAELEDVLHFEELAAQT